MHRDVPYFIILLCLMPDNITRHRESAATQWDDQGAQDAEHLWREFGKLQWVIPENIHTSPTEEIGCPNTLTIIRNIFFSSSGRQKFPLWGGVWIFSGTTQYNL